MLQDRNSKAFTQIGVSAKNGITKHNLNNYGQRQYHDANKTNSAGLQTSKTTMMNMQGDRSGPIKMVSNNVPGQNLFFKNNKFASMANKTTNVAQINRHAVPTMEAKPAGSITQSKITSGPTTMMPEITKMEQQYIELDLVQPEDNEPVKITGLDYLDVKEDYFDSKFKVEQGNQNTFAISDGETHLLVDPKFHSSQLGPNFIFFEIFDNEILMGPDEVNAKNFGAIVLSDHCHVPTLELLGKDNKIIASAKGAQTCRDLGFTNVIELDHGESTTVGNIKINAVPGFESKNESKNTIEAQNGYVFSVEDESMLFEPHGDAHVDLVKYLGELGEIQSAILPMSEKYLKNFPVLKLIPAKVNKFVDAMPGIKRIYDLPNKEDGKIKEFFVTEKKVALESANNKIEVVNLQDLVWELS